MIRAHPMSALVLVLLVSFAEAATPPNIVMVMTDDQGYGDFGFTGNPVLRTPNLDRMAAGSARLSRFYVSPVCTPTRASLLTGRHAQRTRAFDTYVGRAQMEPEEVTLAEILRDAGYVTGVFGKWHLGDAYPMRAIDQGFDEALVHRGGGLAQPSEPIENERRYTDAIMFRNGALVATEGYCTDVQFEAGIEFIERAVAAERPFLAYISTNAPHDPLHDVPEELRDHYASADLAPVLDGFGEATPERIDRTSRVFAMIENIDDNVGRLLATIDRLGIAENTIVLFLTDNGPAGARFVGPFRGTKGQVREGGIRTVSLWHQPGTLPPGESAVLSAHIDVLPTLLDLADLETPEGLRLDGISMAPWLRDPTRPVPSDRTLVIQAHRGDVPVRRHHIAVHEGRWKLTHETGFGKESMPADVPYELHDVVSDPGERRDLALERPEVVARLLAAYDAWYDDIAGTRPDPFARPRIVAGTPHETSTALTRQDWTRTDARGWGRQGAWHLSVARPTTFDVEVVRASAGAGETIELRFGRTMAAGMFEPGARRAWIRGVELPEGDLDLRSTIGDDEDRGAYQIVLHARPASSPTESAGTPRVAPAADE
jgi:arylsulfatase A-like enzyme